MREIFKYEKNNWYPHMSVSDREIWERFIDKYPDAFEQVQYDFHVGDAPAFNTLMDDDTDWNQDKLYRLRIDVVGFTKNEIVIVECKPNAGPSTIGQVKSYTNLYIRDEEPQIPVKMMILTNSEKPNMQYLCKSEGVSLVVV